jgi:serine/threonine protein kinase
MLSVKPDLVRESMKSTEILYPVPLTVSEGLGKPEPLKPEVLLAHQRYQIKRVLGQSTFCTTYEAVDLRKRDLCIIRELSPFLSTREPSNYLSYDSIDVVLVERLKNLYAREFQQLKKISSVSLPVIREVFQENCTVYVVREYLEDVLSVRECLAQGVRLDVGSLQNFLSQLCHLLEQLSKHSIHHENIKPSNILLSPKKKGAYLIDFGQTQSWFADLTQQYEVFYDLEYSAPELRTRNKLRGVVADIYGLSATFYTLFHQASHQFGDCSSYLEHFLDVLNTGREFSYQDRPKTFTHFQKLLFMPQNRQNSSAFEVLDKKLLELRELRFQKRECPVCHEIIEKAFPLRLLQCPVCREGKIGLRPLSHKLCAVCKTGVLCTKHNDTPLRFCPTCKTGHLQRHRRLFKSKLTTYLCKDCHTEFLEGEEGVTEALTGRTATWNEWRKISGRACEIKECDTCNAQYDVQSDGRWFLYFAPEKAFLGLSYSPWEWEKIAAGLDVYAGNARCDICNADFFVDKKRHTLTLLGHEADPYGFGHKHAFQLLDLEAVRWLGRGKQSFHVGYACPSCSTEFDQNEIYLKLIFTESVILAPYVGESYTLENWHRLAHNLPLVGFESSLEDQLEHEIYEAYTQGRALDYLNNKVLWKGQAAYCGCTDQEASAYHACQIWVTRKEVIYGSALHKTRLTMESILDVELDGNNLRLVLSGGKPDIVFVKIEPIKFSLKLLSGKHTIHLDVRHLYHLLKHLIQPSSCCLSGSS